MSHAAFSWSLVGAHSCMRGDGGADMKLVLIVLQAKETRGEAGAEFETTFLHSIQVRQEDPFCTNLCYRSHSWLDLSLAKAAQVFSFADLTDPNHQAGRQFEPTAHDNRKLSDWPQYRT